MINSCIKTGARVFFADVNQLVSADLYKVGNTLVIRTNPKQVSEEWMDGKNVAGAVDVLVDSREQHMPAFWRPDIGVFVLTPNHFLLNPEFEKELRRNPDYTPY